MADASPKLTAADQAMILGAAWVVSHVPMCERATLDMVIDTLRELLPQVNEDHPQVGPLKAVVADLVAEYRPGAASQSGYLRRLLYDLSKVTGDALLSRLGMAMEAARKVAA